MRNNKSPGNNRIRMEFYEAFCDDLKAPLLSVNKAFKVGELKVQSCKLCNSKYMIASTHNKHRWFRIYSCSSLEDIEL